MYLAPKISIKMKKTYNLVLVLLGISILVSCKKDDPVTPFELRDRQEVYNEDILEIEAYLQNNYITVDSNFDVLVDSILPGSSNVSIWDQTDYPLQSITVQNDSRLNFSTTGRIDDTVDYKLYYIVLSEGGGVTPTAVDSTFTSYKGWNMKNETFDSNPNGLWFSFPDANISAISGFRQALSQIKTAESLVQDPATGTVSYINYGNIVVFVPSGLAYFSTSSSTKIGSYAPIAFQIKLFGNKQRDHDRDRVLSNFEDLNANGDCFDDDTDGDGTPDFLDYDDDADGVLTKTEIRYVDPVTSEVLYYDFNSIPNCSGGTIKKHLDATCQ